MATSTKAIGEITRRVAKVLSSANWSRSDVLRERGRVHGELVERQEERAGNTQAAGRVRVHGRLEGRQKRRPRQIPCSHLGVCTYPDGEKYEGDWKDDRKIGQGRVGVKVGTCVYPNGDKYEGHVVDERNGKGVMNYANGDRYEGEWKNDKREGKG